MAYLTTFVLRALALSVIVRGTAGSLSRRHGRVRQVGAKVWKLTDEYKGNDFLEQWDFFDQGDPTHGMVAYQSQSDATKKGLATVGDDNVVVLAVDDTTKLPEGTNRDSVRISSKKVYNGGLFIADFQAMPVGCSVWPAWWSVGPNWPSGGEIDVLEGVNNHNINQYTLHTSSGCSRDDSVKVTGKLVGAPTCGSSGSNNAGCAFQDTDTRSYGTGFNNAGGGVFAHVWDDTGIKIWHFARDEIPEDITSGKPDPTSWSTPVASFASSACNISEFFHDHVLTIDTTLCGDWAGPDYASSGCPGTCAQAVADPTNFVDAKWKINYIAVYN